mmetsp:Transcript_46289/g.68267  ORF Transcript_46289/g.68267 Transcript_46289/m.68267 type:complete len:268 (-) Transcript_46289:114-917(-)
MVPSAAAAFRVLAKSRQSTRRFQPNKKIDDLVLRDILSTTSSSPSGFNLQPTHVLLVRSAEVKKQLSDYVMLAAGNCYRAKDCSVMAVFLCDLELDKRIPRILELEKDSKMRDPMYLATFPVAASFLNGQGQLATMLKQASTNLMSPIQATPTIESVESWGYKNSSLMAQTYVFAAESHGLSTCMMEGFDSRRAKEILRVPDRYAIPLMVATGYEYVEDGQKVEEERKKTPRLPLEEMFFGDTFGERLDLLESDDSQDENELNGRTL